MPRDGRDNRNAERAEDAEINRPDQPLSGAAAVANAVFDATGVRLRTVPFTPARVKAALARG